MCLFVLQNIYLFIFLTRICVKCKIFTFMRTFAGTKLTFDFGFLHLPLSRRRLLWKIFNFHTFVCATTIFHIIQTCVLALNMHSINNFYALDLLSMCLLYILLLVLVLFYYILVFTLICIRSFRRLRLQPRVLLQGCAGK